MRIIASVLAVLPVAVFAAGCVIQTPPADTAPPKPAPAAAPAPKAATSAAPAKKNNKRKVIHFKDAPAPPAPPASGTAAPVPAPSAT